MIGLTVEEARKIEYLLGRPPTVVEAVIWGIQGSEHSSYKSSRRFLKDLPTTGSHVILGPKEDSGIVALTDTPSGRRWGIVMSHESHNHPSQVVPYEGAATGVGGTVRDVLCMGARVIGCMDMLRLGDLKSQETRSIATEVVRGIAGYGNPLGLPNLGGDTVFDSTYNSNCLVNAIAIGIIREDAIIHSYVPEEAAREGYDIILFGKPTDKSGFGGAAFASVSFAQDSRKQNTGAVQEPNPFLERHLLASTYALFDWLTHEKKMDKVSLKDLGAGGIVCATVEQVAWHGYGADVDLDKVPVAIEGLPPEVIACAETQERLCWICHPSLTDHIIRHYNEVWNLPSVAEGACASVIGKVTPVGHYRLFYKGEIVCDAKSQDITLGLKYTRPTTPHASDTVEPEISCEGDQITVNSQSSSRSTFTVREIFEAMLAHPNYASSKPMTIHFDKTVIGNTIIEAGEADATVIMPLQDLHSYELGTTSQLFDLQESDRYRGIALAADGNPRYGKISAFAQGRNATVEAICNVVAVGATPRALTDCLNYGNPEHPEQLGALENGVRGITEAATGIRMDLEPVPVISGNVSLYNSTTEGVAIAPTAIVACAGVLPDGRKAVTMQVKTEGSKLLLVGERRDECGGSAYYQILEQLSGALPDTLIGKNVPAPDLGTLTQECIFVRRVIDEGLASACHDISDGGLMLALFEMLLPQRGIAVSLGMRIDLTNLASKLRSDTLLFSQSFGFILEISANHWPRVGQLIASHHVTGHEIGVVTSDASLVISRSGKVLFSSTLPELRQIHATSLQKAL